VKAIYGFHVHAEYEALKTSKKELFGDKTAVKWNQGLMAGIGKTVNLTKGVKTGILFMYNFLHESDGPYPRPWVIRFGFQF
jgi:choline kinase